MASIVISDYENRLNNVNSWEEFERILNTASEKNIINHLVPQVLNTIDRLIASKVTGPIDQIVKLLVLWVSCSNSPQNALNILIHLCNGIIKGAYMEPTGFFSMVAFICADDKSFVSRLSLTEMQEMCAQMVDSSLIAGLLPVAPHEKKAVTVNWCVVVIDQLVSGAKTVREVLEQSAHNDEVEFDYKVAFPGFIFDILVSKENVVSNITNIALSMYNAEMDAMINIRATGIHQIYPNLEHRDDVGRISEELRFIVNLLSGLFRLTVGTADESAVKRSVFFGKFIKDFGRYTSSNSAPRTYNAMILMSAMSICKKFMVVPEGIGETINELAKIYNLCGMDAVVDKFREAIEAAAVEEISPVKAPWPEFIPRVEFRGLLVAHYMKPHYKNAREILNFLPEGVKNSIATESEEGDPNVEVEATQKTDSYSKKSGRQQRTQNKIMKAFKKYKNNEDKVDSQLSKFLNAAKSAFSGGDKTEEIIDGKKFTPMGLLKRVLVTSAVFNFSKVGGFCYLLTRHTLSKRRTEKERKAIILQLDTEIKLLEEKVEDARSDGNREAKYALMRTKAELERSRDSIKYNLSATKNDLATAKTVINKGVRKFRR